MPSPELESALVGCLARHLGPVTGARVLAEARRATGRERSPLGTRDVWLLLLELPNLMAKHVGPGTVARALEELNALAAEGPVSSQRPAGIVALSIQKESDVVDARSKAIAVAQLAGFVMADAVKVATVVSELARNVLQYAGSGAIEIVSITGRRRGVQVIARDAGPGIANAEEILAGRYKSRTGMGLGLVGSKRLMDTLEIKGEAGRGTVVTAAKFVSP